MNKKFFATSAIGMALANSLCAQSLFDLAPDDSGDDSIPLTYTAGVNIGYDDNPTPFSGNDDSSLYGQAYVGASFLNNSPQTTLSVGVQLGVIHYFDNLDFADVEVDDTSFTASAFLNWTHRVSERLRLVSRNLVAYELEPDYSVGFQALRQQGNYLRYSTDNAVGYRWSERLATYTGIRFDGIIFDDLDGADRNTFTIYNDFRYQVSERTVATLSYRHAEVSGDGQVSDSTNQFILAGIEHRVSPQTSVVLRGGVQLRDVDGGGSHTSPYVEGSFRTSLSERLSVRGYARYGIEDFQRALRDSTLGTVVPVNAVYENTETLRLGFTANYAVSRDLSVLGGVNYVDQSFEDRLSVNGQDSVGEELLNAFVGFDYRMSDSITFNGRYNFEDLTSDAGREYDRNRFSLGVATTF